MAVARPALPTIDVQAMKEERVAFPRLHSHALAAAFCDVCSGAMGEQWKHG